MPTTLVFYRGDEQVAIGFQHDVHRDGMLALARACTGGYRADTTALSMETFHSELPHNPLTGEHWGPNEMQDVAFHHQGREKGWVTDSLYVTVYNRAGDVAGASLPYRRHRRRVEWLETPDLAGGKFSGRVHDFMLRVMREADVHQAMVRTGVDPVALGHWSAEQAEHRMDCIVTREILAHGPDAHIALCAKAGSVREQVIKEMLPGQGTWRP